MSAGRIRSAPSRDDFQYIIHSVDKVGPVVFQRVLTTLDTNSPYQFRIARQESHCLCKSLRLGLYQESRFSVPLALPRTTTIGRDYWFSERVGFQWHEPPVLIKRRKEHRETTRVQ